ncbi:MAG: pilus assembly protein TadG-related protein [Candidatus Omnitrophota bacterium]
MFKKFAQHKTGYNKGQVFPFLIAIICVVIILIMITVNLGQIGVFRTDVSDAADAGALAGASVLSGTLLGLGLKSDMMCGESVVCLIMATIVCCSSFWKGIAILIASFISQLCACFEAMEDATMGWTNAKKTAVQYAFNNSGIDEPRPTFETFLKNPYTYAISDIKKDLTDNQIRTYYDEFLKGESDWSRKYGRPGFSSFIEDDDNGYWKEDDFGKVAPGEMSEVIVTSGYGWEQIPNHEMFYNSYNNRSGITNYNLYRNYVEVISTGAPVYALDIYGIKDNSVLNAIAIVLSAIIGIQTFRQIGGWWGAIIGVIVAALVYLIMREAYPMGLKMLNKDNQYEGNPMRVTVRRHKGEENLGLWKFHYGTIEARAKAHVYREHKGIADIEETVEPCFGELLEDAFSKLSGLNALNPLAGLNAVLNLFSGDEWKEKFAKSRHLFEVELVATN